MSNILISWLLVFLASINSTVGNLMLKKSREIEHLSFVNSLFDLWFLGGLFFYAVNVLFFVKALESLQVSVAYPVLAGLGFLFLSISSSFFLNEKLNSIQIIGIVTILIGIIMLSLSKS